ncbi:sporulation-delaying protein SdpB family protein [Streptomyces sp. NBC_01268]|uniref:sporulation-delaying protein SdpB family protein n=1 Tax=Streptomyces sp. NBC_01268 TaxID=2903806 RepID=UPI002E347DF4|nr:sporulation-delaying protein SdpB family protein [Streptomyces sp. NBC_01268]
MFTERLIAEIERSVRRFPAESRALGAGRSTIALAQASILLFTPASHLFVPVGATQAGVDCSAPVQAMSLYCLADTADRQFLNLVLLVLLLVVASGILPRYTTVLHFWASFSLSQSVSLPDGGDAVSQVVTFFLVLACANDRRTWHWQRPGGKDRSGSLWQGLAWAGWWGVRLQVAYIYLNSAVAKLPVGPWAEGSATYYVARMENFGAAGLFADLFRWATGITVIALLSTWGTILAESLIALFLLRRASRQVVAAMISVALHLLIVLQIGIVSFGFIMVGAVLCAASRGIDAYAPRWRRRFTGGLPAGFATDP